MILAVDVHYDDRVAHAACVGLLTWSDAESTLELVQPSPVPPEAYQPGQFYRRELPHLRQVIEAVRRSTTVDTVIIDGYVWLNENRPGLGAHLYHALGGDIVVVGVAKSAFRGARAIALWRGQSGRPLFVTAAGIEASQAAELVRRMHGPHRIPTLLKRADQLARRTETPDRAKTKIAFSE